MEKKLRLCFLVNKPYLDLEELCELYGFKPKTVYKWTCKDIIPHSKLLSGKLLRFKREEIDKWIDAGEVKTVAEIRKGISNVSKKGGSYGK